MGTECDMKKKVSNLESIGRKICSDLRNCQKERTILSREAKCLLREIEKGNRQARRRHYGKNKHVNSTNCACAIWENDLRKDGERDIEESSKVQNVEQQLLNCENSCNCSSNLDQENNHDDLFEICRYNKLSEPYRCTQSVTIFNDNDDDDYSIQFCDTCIYCKENNGKSMHNLLTNYRLNVNYDNDMEDLIERQRGGGGKSDSDSTYEGTPNLSNCTCDCDICVLRNKYGDRPPCCLQENGQLGRSIDTDYDDNLQLSRTAVSELSEIYQYCKIAKLREALEKLKNRNHTLRKLLKQRECLLTNSMMQQPNCKFCPSHYDHYDDDKNNEDVCGSHRDQCKEPTRELVASLKILQSKCCTKDGMIIALADELKECATNERIKRILDKLTEANIDRDIIDFDRSTLWKYLVPKQFNLTEQDSNKRKRIVDKKAQYNDIMIGLIILSFIILANIHYRYRCTAMFVFRTISEAFCRIYEILQNFQQCFATHKIMVSIVKNCIDFSDTFLSLFNCRQFIDSIEKLMCDFTIFSDDGFPWLGTIFIFTAILILLSHRACYPFILMCTESLQSFYDTYRSDEQNECD